MKLAHKDLSGTVINGITVVSPDHIRKKDTKPGRQLRNVYYYLCRCHCGKEWVTDPGSLKYMEVRSCGCSRQNFSGRHGNTKHGLCGTPTYKAWTSMRERCLTTSNHNYPDYGGRGITVCDRWLESFENFLEDMGIKPASTSLDRKEVNGHYCKENCRWADAATQRANQRPRAKHRDLAYFMDADLALILAH